MIQHPAMRHGIFTDSWPLLERVARFMATRADTARIWSFYRAQGYAVHSLEDVAAVPYAVREHKVSLLRAHYRACIVGEMATGQLAGPLSPAVGVPLLVLILLDWGSQMGWAYGVDMHQSKAQALLAAIVSGDLASEITGAGRKSPAQMALRLLFMGWGQELWWADRVMAHVRRAFRPAPLSL